MTRSKGLVGLDGLMERVDEQVRRVGIVPALVEKLPREVRLGELGECFAQRRNSQSSLSRGKPLHPQLPLRWGLQPCGLQADLETLPAELFDCLVGQRALEDEKVEGGIWEIPNGQQ